MSYRTIKFSSFTIIILFVITCSTNPEEGACGDGYFIDSGVNRISDIESRVQKDIDHDMNVGIFLAYGQSNSENYGELGYTVTNDIFQFYNDFNFIIVSSSAVSIFIVYEFGPLP